MCKLVFLKHLSLIERLECVDLAILCTGDELDLSKSTFADLLYGNEIIGFFFGAEETKVPCFCTTSLLKLTVLFLLRVSVALKVLIELSSTKNGLQSQRTKVIGGYKCLR